jgi:TPR repeat protein
MGRGGGSLMGADPSPEQLTELAHEGDAAAQAVLGNKAAERFLRSALLHDEVIAEHWYRRALLTLPCARNHELLGNFLMTAEGLAQVPKSWLGQMLHRFGIGRPAQLRPTARLVEALLSLEQAADLGSETAAVSVNRIAAQCPALVQTLADARSAVRAGC